MRTEKAQGAPERRHPPVTPAAPVGQQVAAGTVNLQRHVANARAYGVPVVVAINKFASDSPAELAAVRTAAMEAGAQSARSSSYKLV